MALALSAEEVAFFVKEGYLIKEAFMSSELCAQARDILWAGNHSARLSRCGSSLQGNHLSTIFRDLP